MKTIILIAPPAAGKGTQAELISKEYNIPHISIGEILRNISNEDSEIGKYIFETLKSGELVKDDITFQLIEKRLKQKDCKNGFIIDGIPRTLEQAKEFDKMLNRLNFPENYVILINVDKKTLEKRVVGRRVCEKCQATYNINDKDNAPKKESICDVCGGNLYQRSDDNLESFKTRYDMYTEKTIPIIDYYKSKNILKEVDGNDYVLNIFQNIKNIVN